MKLHKFYLMAVLALLLGISGCSTTKHDNKAVNYALKLQGTPYKAGGTSPKTGFDCSGFVSYVYAKSVGLKLPRDSHSQSKTGKSVKRTNLKPGDLVFFKLGKSKKVNHVGIYIGDNNFIHAPSSKGKVRIESLDLPYWQKSYFTARRVY